MIKKVIKDLINVTKTNKAFRKIILSYVITGIIIFLLFGILTVFGVSRSATEQMNATELKMLEQSCNTGNLILRDIHSLASNSYQENAAIREAMTGPYSTETSQRVQSAFDDIMASSNLVDSIYVVNSKYDIIYSTQTSVKKASDFFDDNILDYLSSNPAKIDIYFARSVDLRYNPLELHHADYITSVYRNSPDCALVVNIDQEKFQDIVNLSSDSDSYNTIVIDSDGVIISQSDKEHFAENMRDDPTTARIYDRMSSSEQSRGSFNDGDTIINFVRSDTLGFIYSSAILGRSPLGNFKTLLIYMILFTLLLLFVYFICSVFLSLNTYSLFNNLKKNIYSLFSKDEAEENTGDEVSNISKLLTEVKDSYTSMETIQYQYINSKQNDTLKRILTGTFAYLQDDMNACDITFPYSGFAVVLMHIDHISKMDSDTIYMIKYAVMNMGKEIFDSNAITYAAEINDYDVVFILNFMTDSFITGSIEKLNSYLKKFFDATVSAAYDMTISDSMEDVSVLYHNAKHAIPYKLLKGYASVITYDEVKALDNAISSYPKELEQDIIKSITAQDDNELVKNVQSFTDILSNTSYNLVMLYADRLLLAIYQFSIRSNMSDGNDSASDIRTVISEIETLDELRQFILTKCRNLMLKFSNTKFDSKKDIMVKQVLEYIDKNYTDPNLSIDMISNEINRSANYTRSMFKQSQGISISDYIAKKRFDEVCRQLIETNLTAQEIGTKLGLNSGSYFYTSFKKYTGYTPDQYRKLHHK